MTFDILTVAAFIIAQLADVITTAQGIERGAVERNPIIKALMDKLGILWIPAKLIAASGCAVILWLNGHFWAIWIVSAITAVVAYRNSKVGK